MGSSESEARTTGEDPNGKDIGNKEYKEKDFQGMDPNHMAPEECMRELFQLNQAQKQQINRMEKRINDLENKLSTAEVKPSKNADIKILKRYTDKKENRFLQTVWKGAENGVTKERVAEIFEVSGDRARQIMKKASRQYDFLEWEYPGGPNPGKIYHKLSRVAGEIADKVPHDVNHTDVLEEKFSEFPDKRDLSHLDELQICLDGLEDKYDKSMDSEEAKASLRSML